MYARRPISRNLWSRQLLDERRQIFGAIDEREIGLALLGIGTPRCEPEDVQDTRHAVLDLDSGSGASEFPGGTLPGHSSGSLSLN